MSQLRIIAGKYKGRRISFNPNSSLRPSTNRSKETLFNWLMMNIEGSKCLDMFAGTGSLGIEAISRGAKTILISDKACLDKLKTVDLKVEIPLLDNELNPIFSPIFMSIPAQLLAYHVARERGTDVDQPRNLAKSVTVE